MNYYSPIINNLSRHFTPFVAILIGHFLLQVNQLSVSAASVDLNQFDILPSGATDSITISSDGNSATITESDTFSPIVLSNDPGLGNPQVIVPGSGVTVQFDYEFTKGVNDDDLFEAFILDSSGNPAMSVDTEFSTDEQTDEAVRVTFQLSDLVEESSIGLQFQLFSRPTDLGNSSVVIISNVEINLTSVTATLDPGWNLFSIPVRASPNTSIQVVLDRQADADVIRSKTVWEWIGQQFVIADDIVPGKGYWVYVEGNMPVSVQNFGVLPLSRTETAKKSWNLVGIKDILSVTAPSNPEIRGKIFGWNSENQHLFSIDDLSLPGDVQQMLLSNKAYWIYSTNDDVVLILANP